MASQFSRETILKEVIEGYRKLIHQRYQYENIAQKVDMPDSVDEATVERIRNYFLDFIYPEYTKRIELNEAFKSLDTYTQRPEKLIRIILDSFKLVFSHGRQLPKLLKAGLKAMKSFKTVSEFEYKLTEAAISNHIYPPFDEPKIKELLTSLSRKEIDQFIENTESLILIFRDKPLIKNVKEIVGYLIPKMKKNPNLYASTEILGLELGLEILKEGDELFSSFNFKDQERIIKLIINMERSILDGVFENRGK